MGKNKLSGLAKAMCVQAGFEGHYTGHSGKVICATELFNNNIDEQLIQAQTDIVVQLFVHTNDLEKKIAKRYHKYFSHQLLRSCVIL